MAYYMTPLGGIILYPEIADRAFLNISPLTFVNRLMAANPDMPLKMLTSENIKYTFMGMMTFKQLELSPTPDIRAQRVWLLQRARNSLEAHLASVLIPSQWESSLDWTTLRFMLDGDTTEGIVQSFVPSNRPSHGPSTFVYGVLEFTLPPVSDHLFTTDVLDVERFIEVLRINNQTQQELLDLEIVHAAVEQFALKRFPAAPALVEQSLAQLSLPRGVRALNDHSRWLTHVRQHRGPYPQVIQTPNLTSAKSSQFSLGHYAMLSGSEGVQEHTGKPKSGTRRSSKKKHHENDDMKHAMSHVPEIHVMDYYRRSDLLSRGCSLHVALRPDDTNSVGPKATRTHLHHVPGSEGQTRLEIVPCYNRAIVVEFETQELRDAGIQEVASRKHSFGSTVVKAAVNIFVDSESTRDTVWFFYRSKSDHKHSVHEALRRFFCLQGQVPFKVGVICSLGDVGPSALYLNQIKFRLIGHDIIVKQSGLGDGKEVVVNKATSPVWLQKLAANHIGNVIYELRDARTCELCEVRTRPALSYMTVVGTQEHRSMFENNQTSSLGTHSQLARSETAGFKRLALEDEDRSPMLAARKRVAEEMDSPEDGQIVPKKEKISEDVDGSEEVGEFLESLGKELEGSKGHGSVWVKTEPIDAAGTFL